MGRKFFSKSGLCNICHVVNSLFNESKSLLSQAVCSSGRPINDIDMRIVDQMLSDITECSPDGPRLSRCRFKADRKCSIASLFIKQNHKTS